MLLKRTYLKIVAVVILVLFLSISIQPNLLHCPSYRPSICGLITNATLAVGATVVLITEIESKVFPGISVRVELDSGDFRSGILTRKAAGGRKVSSGDTVRLNCHKSYASTVKGNKVCELEFLGFDPNSACPKGTPCYGEIPSFGIEVDAQGIPDSNLLKFQTP